MPYAILNIASPLITIAFAYLGIRMLRAQGTPDALARSKPQPNAQSDGKD